MKLLEAFPFFCLLILWFHPITYQTESFSESTEPLSNPYQGFYHMIGYTLSDDYVSTDNYSSQADSYTDTLALLEESSDLMVGLQALGTLLEELESCLRSLSTTAALEYLVSSKSF